MSCQPVSNHSAVDVSQAEVAAAVAVGEPRVVEAEEVEHRGLQVVYVHRFFNRFEPEFVGRSIHGATLHAAAGHPYGESVMVVVAA